ncbi:MAG: preQ(1) synthase [Bacteroidia bacterium]|nr:preQ(1) synthase [Bacteroidia bacterium]MDW8157852.1 preQ(1) synthase [Bacteroidia bacterium]
MKDEKKEIRIADTRGEIQAEEKYQLLQTFELLSEQPQWIHIHTKEFSAVCPGTGLPDIGTLDIDYIPRRKCVELKSLKYYLFSYRDAAIFQEPVTEIIFQHLWRLLEPYYLRVNMVYNTRGGFDTTVWLEKGDPGIINPQNKRILP